jgi:uncharacterized protein (TIGR03382 family)
LANAGDAPAFLSAIDNALLVQNQSPWLRVNYIADFNADLVLDARDIPGFEQACACVIPEPSTIGWPLALLLSVASRARRIKR